MHNLSTWHQKSRSTSCPTAENEEKQLTFHPKIVVNHQCGRRGQTKVLCFSVTWGLEVPVHMSSFWKGGSARALARRTGAFGTLLTSLSCLSAMTLTPFEWTCRCGLKSAALTTSQSGQITMTQEGDIVPSKCSFQIHKGSFDFPTWHQPGKHELVVALFIWAGPAVVGFWGTGGDSNPLSPFEGRSHFYDFALNYFTLYNPRRHG